MKSLKKVTRNVTRWLKFFLISAFKSKFKKKSIATGCMYFLNFRELMTKKIKINWISLKERKLSWKGRGKETHKRLLVWSKFDIPVNLLTYTWTKLRGRSLNYSTIWQSSSWFIRNLVGESSLCVWTCNTLKGLNYLVTRLRRIDALDWFLRSM